MSKTDDSLLDDPVWEYTVATKLMKYIPAIKKWWEHYENLKVTGTGVFDFMLPEGDTTEIPPGLQVRMTSTPVRSPIKNVQAFPFLPTAYLQISGVYGGVNRMIERVCDKGLELEEFKIIEKHNLPSTYHRGQFVAFIPKDIYQGSKSLGKYVYLTVAELSAMAKQKLPQSVVAKCYQYIK